MLSDNEEIRRSSSTSFHNADSVVDEHQLDAGFAIVVNRIGRLNFRIEVAREVVAEFVERAQLKSCEQLLNAEVLRFGLFGVRHS